MPGAGGPGLYHVPRDAGQFAVGTGLPQAFATPSPRRQESPLGIQRLDSTYVQISSLGSFGNTAADTPSPMLNDAQTPFSQQGTPSPLPPVPSSLVQPAEGSQESSQQGDGGNRGGGRTEVVPEKPIISPIPPKDGEDRDGKQISEVPQEPPIIPIPPKNGGDGVQASVVPQEPPTIPPKDGENGDGGQKPTIPIPPKDGKKGDGGQPSAPIPPGPSNPSQHVPKPPPKPLKTIYENGTYWQTLACI